MSVTIEIAYEGGLLCSAIHPLSGEKLCTDAPLDNGGKGSHFSPTDLVATGLGTCIATIMGLAAERLHLDIRGLTVAVGKEMTATGRRRIGALTVKVALPKSLQLTTHQREKLEAAALSCPVKESLHPEIAVAIEFHY